MAVTYRLVGTGFDVFLDTDASRSAKEFFITDIRELDATDIQNGFEIGLEQYNEGMLAQFAMDNDIELYSFDEQRNERCVVRQLAGNPAGRFDGENSRLTFSPGFALATGGVVNYPIVIEMIVRFSAMDIATMYDSGNSYALVSSDTNDDDYFTLDVQGNDVNEVSFGSEWNVNAGDDSLANNVIISEAAERCINIRWTLEDIGGITQANISIADEMTGSQTGGTATFDMDVFDFVFGSDLDFGPEYGNYFLGIMRSIVVSAGGTEIINVVNPSTGVNSVGTNGVVTDIESVTTIT